MDIDLRRVAADAGRLGFSERDLPGVERMAANVLTDPLPVVGGGLGGGCAEGAETEAQADRGGQDGQRAMR